MARHAGLEIAADDWRAAYDIPLIVNMQPAGKYLGERFHRAGGAPAVVSRLISCRSSILACCAMQPLARNFWLYVK